MPNQSDPNQNNQQSNSSSVQQPVDLPPVIFPQSDLPPLPPTFQSANSTAVDQPATIDVGSGAPPEIPPEVSKPRKKFGSGKIIATILGLVVLVGGVGAGVLLTQQQQILTPQACGSNKISCVALTKDSSAPKVNDTINLTCEANFSSGSPVAYFRYQAPGSGNFVEDSNSYPINSSSHKATKSAQVSTVGAWVWQCRVCTNTSKTTCTDWGQSG